MDGEQLAPPPCDGLHDEKREQVNPPSQHHATFLSSEISHAINRLKDRMSHDSPFSMRESVGALMPISAAISRKPIRSLARMS
jgi:hypothetical protein